MRVQKTILILGSLCSLVVPLTARAESRIVTIWEDRPRFFTAEPGEEHSRFYTLVSAGPSLFGNHHRCCRGGCCTKTVAYTPTCSRCSSETPCSTCSTRLTSSCDRCSHHCGSRCSTVANNPPCSTCSKTRLTSLFGSCKHRCRTHCDTVAYATPTCATCDRCNSTVTGAYYTTTNEPVTSTGYVSVITAPTVSDTDPNSYGASTHGNVTQRTIAPGSQFTLTSDLGNRTLDSVIANWPQESRTVAKAMQSKYGKPDSLNNDQIVWRDQDPWAEITVFKNGTLHNDPTPHNDVLAQSIYFEVDANKLDALNNFRGNIKVDPSRGLLTCKCKDEAMCFLALNLAHDILQGEKSVVEANNVFAEKARSGTQGDDEYMTGLRFDVGTEIGSEKNINTESDLDNDVDRD